MTNVELALEFCQYAAERLKSAGFKHVYTSQKSEACYYRYPIKEGLLRVAIHRFNGTESRMIPRNYGKTVSTITFHPHNLGLSKSWEWVDMKIEQAVGKYFLHQEQRAKG